MRKNDIIKTTTPFVSAVMEQGYSLCFEYRGSQSGVDGYTILQKGLNRIIVWQETKHGYGSDYDTVVVHYSQIVLKPGETIERDHCWSDDWTEHDACWNEFYALDCEGRWFTTSKHDAEKAKATRKQRLISSPDFRDGYRHDIETTPELARIARNHAGFKKLADKDIRVQMVDSERNHAYYFSSRKNANHNFELRIR